MRLDIHRYMYLSSGKGSGKRRIACGLCEREVVGMSRQFLNATLTTFLRQVRTSFLHRARDTHGMITLPDAFLLVGQIVIVVDELAIELEDVGSTEPADAATAQIRNLHAGSFDTFEEALVGDNMHIEIGSRQAHIERRAGGGALNCSQ